jgi:threonylcarbamoyladenosine tRNA methylthiotransferase MtaB
MVIGCYSQVGADEISVIPGVSHILGTTEKLTLLDHLDCPAAGSVPCIRVRDARHAPAPLPLIINGFSRKTRAFLKIQDGCDAFCSYCIVPYARGRSRSIGLTPILDQVERFLSHGYQEVVLTGIHLGQWGADLQPRQNLVALLQAILHHCPPPRLRLSSLEPGEITPELLVLMDTRPELCPHLHVPLQSGDVTVLSRMNRHYHPDFYGKLVDEATTLIPDLAVGADVLVGFPGETEPCFLNTYRLLESLPLAYLHVFPFSPRPGTPAADMGEQVSPAVIRHRSRLLRELDQTKRLAFMHRFLGKTREVLMESRWDESSGMRRGFSDNYLPVLVQAESAGDNQIIMATMNHLQGTQLVATPV